MCTTDNENVGLSPMIRHQFRDPKAGDRMVVKYQTRESYLDVIEAYKTSDTFDTFSYCAVCEKGYQK